jgi:hypothetical protein
LSGALVAELFAMTTTTVRVTRTLTARVAMSVGFWLLPPSLALLLPVQVAGSMNVLIVATALGGIASDRSFRAAYRRRAGPYSAISLDAARSLLTSSAAAGSAQHLFRGRH